MARAGREAGSPQEALLRRVLRQLGSVALQANQSAVAGYSPRPGQFNGSELDQNKHETLPPPDAARYQRGLAAEPSRPNLDDGGFRTVAEA